MHLLGNRNTEKCTNFSTGARVRLILGVEGREGAQGGGGGVIAREQAHRTIGKMGDEGDARGRRVFPNVPVFPPENEGKSAGPPPTYNSVRNASPARKMLFRLPEEHFTKVPPWRKMGLQVVIEPPKKLKAAYRPEAVTGVDFSKRIGREDVGGEKPETRASVLRRHTIEPQRLHPRSTRDEEKPADRPPSCEPSAGTIRSAYREKTHKTLQTVVVGSQVAEHSSSEEDSANVDASAAPHIVFNPAAPERSSSEEYVPSATICNERSSSEGDVPSATICNEDVALTVLPEEEEKGEDVHAPSCCRDWPLRDQYFVGLHSTSIVIWVVLGACCNLLPVAAFWSILVVLIMVHIVEGYYSDTHSHLRHLISSAFAVQRLNQLRESEPKIVWRVGTATGTPKVFQWHDVSKRAPNLQQYAMIKLTIKSDYTIADERRYLSQKTDFRTLHLRSPTDIVQEQLLIAGFSDYTHSNARSTPMMQTMVSTGKAHPLANPVCFWVFHMSVVMALPYRLWLSSISGAVTHVVAKNIHF